MTILASNGIKLFPFDIAKKPCVSPLISDEKSPFPHFWSVFSENKFYCVANGFWENKSKYFFNNCKRK